MGGAPRVADPCTLGWPRVCITPSVHDAYGCGDALYCVWMMEKVVWAMDGAPAMIFSAAAARSAWPTTALGAVLLAALLPVASVFTKPMDARMLSTAYG
jgi:hypothetical protein